MTTRGEVGGGRRNNDRSVSRRTSKHVGASRFRFSFAQRGSIVETWRLSYEEADQRLPSSNRPKRRQEARRKIQSRDAEQVGAEGRAAVQEGDTMKKIKGVYEKVPGSNIWWIRYADVSGRIRREVAGSKSVAIKLYQKRKTEVLQRKKLPENLRTVVRISDLAPAITRDYAVNNKKSGAYVERRLRKHILPFFGDVAADELGTDKIENYVDDRRKEGAENSTINRELAALKRIFNLAKSTTPPKVRSVPTFPRLKENPAREGFVENQNYEKLQLHTDEVWFKAMIACGYTFGLRRGELLSLKVRQMDRSRRMIYLEVGTTKNDDARRVNLTGEVYELLARCVQNKQPEDYIFTRADGKPVLNFRSAWYALCIRAGLGKFVKAKNKRMKWCGLIFHDLRRSAIRNMVRAGVHEKVVMLLSGHKTRSVFDRYNITSDADITHAASLIERARQQSLVESKSRRKSPTGTITDTREGRGVRTKKVA